MRPGDIEIDYTHDYDYNPCAAEWVDCTTVGSMIESQLDANKMSHYRHRNTAVMSPWVKGTPPVDTDL